MPPLKHARKRQLHKKSKNGCSNCKLRRVKCDEAKPNCRNCIRFMVSCDYLGDSKDDLSTRHTLVLEQVFNIAPMKTVSLNQSLLSMINLALLESYPLDFGQALQLDISELEKLHRWQTRTVLTMASPAISEIYQRELIRVIGYHPFLLHAALAVTTKHDRVLQEDKRDDPERKALEYFHHSRAASLFNRKLSGRLDPTRADEQDALWATVIRLGHLATVSIETDDRLSIWPLEDGTSGEALTWLKIHEGFKLLWQLAEPYAPGRMLNQMTGSEEHTWMMTKFTPYIESGITGIPEDWISICNLDRDSTQESSPYLRAIRQLLPLFETTC